MSAIKINDRWSIDRDRFSWCLRETTYYIAANDTAHSKKGEEKQSTVVTWHATIAQVCKKIINMDAKGGESVDGIIEAIDRAEENIVQAIMRSSLQTSQDARAEDLSV